MTTFIVFAVSLILISLLFLMKSFEIYRGRKIFLEDFFLKCDKLIHQSALKIRFWWSQISFRNIGLIFSWIVANIRESSIALKRRFDHEQSHFFTKKEIDLSKPKNSPSFFLKDVAEYKKTLREGNGGGKIES